LARVLATLYMRGYREAVGIVQSRIVEAINTLLFTRISGSVHVYPLMRLNSTDFSTPLSLSSHIPKFTMTIYPPIYFNSFSIFMQFSPRDISTHPYIDATLRLLES
jgi:hypothetical protein